MWKLEDICMHHKCSPFVLNTIQNPLKWLGLLMNQCSSNRPWKLIYNVFWGKSSILLIRMRKQNSRTRTKAALKLFLSLYLNIRTVTSNTVRLQVCKVKWHLWCWLVRKGSFHLQLSVTEVFESRTVSRLELNNQWLMCSARIHPTLLMHTFGLHNINSCILLPRFTQIPHGKYFLLYVLYTAFLTSWLLPIALQCTFL